MNLEQYFKNSKIHIWKETFAITKTKKTDPNAFTSIVDKYETTVIIDEKHIDPENTIEAEKGWKIFTLDIVFPMDVCGVTAKVATALAEKGISVMPIAAYSRDHFLIKEENLDKAKHVFKDMGVSVL